MSLLTASHYFDADESRFVRCLDAMRRLASITSNVQPDRRVARQPYEARPFVAAITPHSTETLITFETWAHDLSRRGIGLLGGPTLIPQVMSDATPPLDLRKVCCEGAGINVGLVNQGHVWWVHSKVIRMRPMLEGLFEIGLEFVCKITQPDECLLQRS